MATLGRRLPPRPVPARAEPTGYAAPGDRAARGKSCRSKAPRSSHAAWEPPPDRQRSDCAARRASSGARTGARADPLRTHVGVTVCVLSGCGVRDGLGPGRYAADRHSGAALRRRASGQLRRIRVAGAAVAVRPRRLRRDAARTVGMGREATGGERSCRGSRQRLQAETAGGDDPAIGRRVPTRDPPVRHDEDAGRLVPRGPTSANCRSYCARRATEARSSGSTRRSRRAGEKTAPAHSRSSPFRTTASCASGPTPR